MSAGTRADAAAVLAVEAGGVVRELRRGARLAPRILDRGGDGALRAVLVPTQAGPLAGDHDRVRIAVGAGAILVVEPVAATLALPGAARTTLELDVTVAAGGRLVLDEGPLIVAAGADVQRRSTLALDEDAVVALRETIVLGRDGEQPGTLDGALRATLGGRALLHDGLRTAGGAGDAHVALAPGHRIVCTACLLGMRPPEPIDGEFALDGPGALLRSCAEALAPAEAAVAPAWAAWSALAAAPAPASTRAAA